MKLKEKLMCVSKYLFFSFILSSILFANIIEKIARRKRVDLFI